MIYPFYEFHDSVYKSRSIFLGRFLIEKGRLIHRQIRYLFTEIQNLPTKEVRKLREKRKFRAVIKTNHIIELSKTKHFLKTRICATSI